MMIRTILCSVFALVGLSAAQAQSPTSLGKFNDWTAWSYSGAKGKVCYMHAVPKTMKPDGLKHGDVSFFVRKSPAEGIQSEANLVVGYPFKENSTVTVDIDGQKFTMFTQGDSAWLLDAKQEPQLVGAMRAGKQMSVAGVSQRGNETSYSYSLSGVTAANDKIRAECK